MIAPSFISVEMFFREHALVAGDRAEHVADLGGFGHRHHAEAVHHGFERLGRIDFGDDDFGAIAARPAGKTASAPSVAGDHELRSRQQEVGRANNAVDRRLPRAVAVVEQVLGIGIVHRDDREFQHAFLRHRAQANHAGGGLFGSADHAFERVRALGVQDA